MTETMSSDVIEVLKSQHEQVKSLLSRVAEGSGDALENAFCDLRRMIVMHETAEEEVVYPAVRSTGQEGTRVAEARTAEEAEGTKVLARLEEMKPGSSEFSELFKEFRTAVLNHAEAEEAEVFPILAQKSSEDRSRMAKLFEVAERAAPTHAHPHTGTGAMSNLVAGPVLAIVDRVRDALQRA